MVRQRNIVSAILTIALWLTAFTAYAAPEIQHWQTAQGMRVYFVPAPELPMLDIRLAMDAGSGRDGELPGLARLTSGLLNKGTGKLSADDVASRFEDVGAQYSARAGRDMLTISFRSLNDAQFLDPALETLMGVVTAPSFPERDFERAKNLTQITLQEQDQDPGDIGAKAFYRAVYGDHPFANPVTGTEESVAAIKREHVAEFHKRYFVAANTVMALVGDVSRDQAEKIAGRISAGLSSGEKAPPLPEVKPLTESKTVRVPFPSAQAHVYIGQPGMSRRDPHYFPLYVGNHVLGGSGFNSRLVKEVRIDRGLSYSVYSYFVPQSVKGPFLVNLQTRVDQAEEAVQLVKDTIKEFLRRGPSDVELTASTRNITGGFPLRIDSNNDVVEYLSAIAYYELPLNYLNAFNGKVTAVKKAAIRTAFQERIDLDKLVTVIVGGNGEG
ncbi:MAG: M16 family metallopeptidase [Gammaproteobacteria bacterium]